MSMSKYTPEQQVTAFWLKVNKNGSIPEHCPELGNCWEWTAFRLSNGYGLLHTGLAHRFSWKIANGEIPKGLFVLHKCDNRSCVNPAHLFLGTQLDNMRDMHSKGRAAIIKGEQRTNHKLTSVQANEIRERYKQGGLTTRSLALEYNVSSATIWRVVNGKSYT